MPILPNAKHELFVQEMAKGISAAEAYRNAGYAAKGASSAVNANKLLKQPNVRERLNELLSQREKTYAKATEMAAEALAIDREWIMRRLKENAERALQAIQAKDEDGAPAGEYKYEGSVANRALELLGKELGMFIERRESGGPGDFERLSDAELRATLAADLAAIDENRARIEAAASQGIAGRSRRLN